MSRAQTFNDLRNKYPSNHAEISRLEKFSSECAIDNQLQLCSWSLESFKSGVGLTSLDLVKDEALLRDLYLVAFRRVLHNHGAASSGAPHLFPLPQRASVAADVQLQNIAGRAVGK